MLLHKQGDTYKWYTRKATDYTDLYGASVEDRGMVKLIHSSFSNGVTRFARLFLILVPYSTENWLYLKSRLGF